ncbi:MAG: lytic transglycosylase domain-containing protein [Actinomycetes bacterium]
MTSRVAGPRLVALIGLVLASLTVAACSSVNDSVTGVDYPLRHASIIRDQAAKKGLDPALIAAVIFAESHFRPGQVSSAGAEGLMQITPETARDIARHSGGTAFTVADLATPKVNISYGSYLLRDLIARYNGNIVAALAAYNAGPGNVDRWGGSALTVEQIPYAETKAYVKEVLNAQDEYRRRYASELGPAP